MFKLPHNCTHHATKGMLKILQARLQQYMNHEVPEVQAGFEKAEEPEIKLPTSAGSSKKQESSRKTSALLTTLKPLIVWITTNCGTFFRRQVRYSVLFWADETEEITLISYCFCQSYLHTTGYYYLYVLWLQYRFSPHWLCWNLTFFVFYLHNSFFIDK